MTEKPVNQAELVATMSAEEYDVWFKEQVEIGMREAADPNAVLHSNDEVMRMLDDMRAEWRERARLERDVA